MGHGIDVHDLAVDADVEAEALVELLRRLEQQVVLVLDDAADEVGQPAVGVGDVSGALEDDDLDRLVEAAEAGGGRHPAGDAADDDHLPERTGTRLGGGLDRCVRHRTHPHGKSDRAKGEFDPVQYTPWGTRFEPRSYGRWIPRSVTMDGVGTGQGGAACIAS